MRKKLLLLAVIALAPSAASARKPEIIQISPDTYMVSKSDYGGVFGGGLPKLKAALIKQANEFAANQGKIAIPVASSEKPMGNGPAQWATFEYQFRVVDKADPEARRTSLSPVPDTVISIEGMQPQLEKPATNESVDDLYSRMLKLDDLRKRGLITDAEFEMQKRKLLED